MAVNTVIACNVLALNVDRNVGLATRRRDKSSNRLSSGSKITTASEGAADLTISEKMKALIRGLDVAEKNVEDAKSFLQLADSAYSEIQDMSQHCREIFVQAKNDTNTNEDRKKLINEVDELLSEISESLTRTEFNGKSILDFNNALIQVGNATGQSINMPELGAIDLTIYDKVSEESISDSIGKTIFPAIEALRNINIGGQSGATGSTIKFSNHQYAFNIADVSIYTIKINEAIENINLNLFPMLEQEIQALKQTIENSVKKASDATKQNWERRRPGEGVCQVQSNGVGAVWPNGTLITHEDVTNMLQNPGDKVIVRYVDATTLSDELKSAVEKFEAKFNELGQEQFTFDMQEHLSLYLEDKMDFSSSVMDMYIEKFDEIIAEVSDIRTVIGSALNALEHTSENIKISSENLYSANSKIADTDMSEEMVEFTATNILIQSATALMAQANSSKEDVISLLN